MPGKKNWARLHYADSETDPDQKYWTGFQVPDPFWVLEHRKKTTAALSDLEINRARKESNLDDIISLKEISDLAQNKMGDRSVASQIAWFAAEKKITSCRVPPQFPLFLADGLRERGLEVIVKEDFHPREFKTDKEANEVAKANKVVAGAFRLVHTILSEAKISGKSIQWKGKVLTSEILQGEIDKYCLDNGAIAANTIVAGGDQACDPHCRGSGPLPANQLIIVDIFPKLKSSGYHGDMTRVFFKGKPSAEVTQLVKTVHQAQKSALALVRHGVDGQQVHHAVEAVFSQNGYPTEQRNGVPVGFFHGTGHGLGLAVHEPPRVGRIAQKLQMGHIITIEPGLYYPGLGGARIEDVVYVTQDGCRMLSKAPYRWVIP